MSLLARFVRTTRGEDVTDAIATQQHDATHSERKMVVFLN